MNDCMSVARRPILILNALGLHLRPADRFVCLARQFRADVRVHGEGRYANGKSILDLASLAAECGAQLELEARGDDAEAAVAALAELVASRFNESVDEAGPASGLYR